MKLQLSLLVVLGVSHLASAFYTPGLRIQQKIDAKQQNALTAKEKLPEKYGPYYFDQPVDHFSLDNATFKHRYWANTDHYKEGGPVILYNAGETPADGRSFYVLNSTMAELAKQLEGIVIVMEHRFYGKSMPAPDFTAESLSTLNTEQALADMASFITDLELPNLDVKLPPAPETKYIVYGGSYSGNLAAWMRQKYPDLVFAAVPSSAPVQMSFNYWQYYEPIRKYGPEHCIDAVQSVIRFVDHILFTPFNKEAAYSLKKLFGAEELQHDDDFAEVLSYPLGMWQAMTPAKNPFENKFCGIFDGLSTVHDYVDAYGNYTKNILNNACDGEKSINECLDTHDPRSKQYQDVNDPNRAWLWQVCTEYAYWQTAAPFWRPSIVSRKLDTAWYQRQCPFMFGEHAVPTRPSWRQINHDYEGWHTKLDRVYFLDGEYDPWRTLSVNSDDAPDRSEWSDDAYYEVLPKGVHHWDFFVSDSVSEPIKKIQDNVLQTLKRWLQEANVQKLSRQFMYQHLNN